MWKLWRGKNEPVESVSDIVSSINRLGDRMGGLEERLQRNEEERESRENKLLRMQYKNTHEILENLEGLNNALEKTLHGQESLMQAEEEKGLMFECMLNILDDLDLVTDKIGKEEDSQWRDLFLAWSRRIIETLQALKIHEIPLLGREFNPFQAEALGTVKKEDVGEDAFACQVVKVYRRGFCFTDGSVIRKARVLTVEEAGPLPPAPAPEAVFIPGILPQKENARSLRRNRLSSVGNKLGLASCMRKRRNSAFPGAGKERKQRYRHR